VRKRGRFARAVAALAAQRGLPLHYVDAEDDGSTAEVVVTGLDVPRLAAVGAYRAARSDLRRLNDPTVLVRPSDDHDVHRLAAAEGERCRQP